MWKTGLARRFSTGFPHTYPPVFHIPLTRRGRPGIPSQPAETGSRPFLARALPPSRPGPAAGSSIARKEHTTSAADIAVLIAAGANAAGVLLGVGAISQKLTDVRDDMRQIRQDIQSCLQTLVLRQTPGNQGKPD